MSLSMPMNNQQHVYLTFYTEHHCQHYDPPLNGALTCERRLNNRFCTVSCNEDYEFSREPESVYFCASDESTRGAMAWSPPPFGNQDVLIPWPDCSGKVIRKY